MPSLDRVTPAILTYDEEANIGRTLSRLTWAERVVVVDSGSEDGTQKIVGSFQNAELFIRPFDCYSQQWNHALKRVKTEWMLALDADYMVPRELVEEIGRVPNDTEVHRFFVEFDYVVLGSRLSRTLYPPRQVLFRADRAVFEDDGHRQRVRVKGPSGRLEHRIVHDDRKPLSRWLRNQAAYAEGEAEKLATTPWTDLSIPDRIRRTRVLGPIGAMLYCLFVKRLLLEGWPGWYYTLERTAAEVVLALALFRRNW